MALKKLGQMVLTVRDLDRSVYFEDPDGHMLEVTYEKPQQTWHPGRNPFAGRAPLPFQVAGR